MENLTLSSFCQSRCLMGYGSLTQRISYPLTPPPCKPQCQKCQGVQGLAPWPQRSAPTSPSAEGWREFQREGGNAWQSMVPSLSLSVRKPLQQPRFARQDNVALH